jgi:Zn-dependent M16 (insulinase) family peptidase
MRLAPLLAFTLALGAVSSGAADIDLGKLKKGDVVRGFRAEAVYLDDAGKPLGARFVHRRSGFVLDYLRIESVPQGYTWVNSIPTGDQGEPHTQEHLLLGKGTKGRSFAGLDTMWLSGSSAFTQQWRTSYHFNTTAGEDVFFDLFAAELDALLHPNYSDEEIRREVRHFGVTSAADGTLRLEEKGSVYNEMTSSSANRYRVLFRQTGHLLYGKAHPLAFNSGGEPSGIRTMKPEDIRSFHAANYYLGNMGTMVAFPKSTPLTRVLERTAAILESVEKEPASRPSTTSKPFPPPEPAPAGTIAIAEYPHRNPQQPSPLTLAWPPTRELAPEEYILLELFASNIAGDATTNLYRLFVDSRTRVMETGATGVFSSVGADQGHPVSVTLDNVSVANLTPETIAGIRNRVMGEISRIASLDDGSPELKEFNERILSRVGERERNLANFVNQPPGWGARGTGSGWLNQLTLLEKTPGFRKSVTLAPQLASIRAQLGSEKNIWRANLAKWGIAGVTPYGVAAKPSPALIEQEEAARNARAEAEAKRLTASYGLEDVQEAIRRYRDEYDAESARIEAEANAIAPPKFIEKPPMTLDDRLDYVASKLEGGVPLVASTFDNMTSATLGIALRADGIAPEHLRYLSLLPILATRVGVIEDGTPVPWEEMSERLRREVLRLSASFSTNARTGRVELVVYGAGLGTAEAARGIEWMSLVLHTPDWRVENLPRIRDVVDQTLSGLRNTMQGSEESWVNNPALAWRMQSRPDFLATDSFLTRAHNALRLRWLLKEIATGDREPVAAAFGELAAAAEGRSRDELKALLAAGPPATVPESARPLLAEAYRDLDLTLLEIPDGSLEADWRYLVLAMRDDLLTPPAAALARLDAARRALLNRDNARMFFVSSAANRTALMPKIEQLAGSLGEGKTSRSGYEAMASHVASRLGQREPEAKAPLYAGLLAPNMTGGVITTSVPAAHFSDAGDREKQLDYLASRLHSGYGAHGVFLKTLAAGLAYSNGLRGSVQSGRVGYYAERTPEIPQTVGFVVETLRAAAPDRRLADYAVAQVFGESRAAAGYEARAEGIAADLADGQSPDQVRRFRQSILDLRKDPALAETLFARKDAVYSRMLPGYAEGIEVPDAVYFAIGPDRQLDAWERYLAQTEGDEARLWRLYPRDFWIP